MTVKPHIAFSLKIDGKGMLSNKLCNIKHKPPITRDAGFIEKVVGIQRISRPFEFRASSFGKVVAF